MELYFQTLNFAFKSEFTPAKISTFFSILKLVHFHAITTPGITLEALFGLFKSLLVNHSIPRPPYSVLVFSLLDVQNITNYVTNTYFRHLKLYLYIFTKKRVLHIHNGTTNIEVPPLLPPLSQANMLPPVVLETAESLSLPPSVPSDTPPPPDVPLDQVTTSRSSLRHSQQQEPEPDDHHASTNSQPLSLASVMANELSKEVQALASASITAQFDKLKSDFEKKMKMHEQVLMEKLELMESKSKKSKPK
eukprot:Phypoly_transcript_16733.p1 GENE.Phypoly_transcript_16733~~Phypoly_transcript_16733.p1  ORF type:complete len:249 (+),score=46.30 Phypoly_transcript_16733:1-747(+)